MSYPPPYFFGKKLLFFKQETILKISEKDSFLQRTICLLIEIFSVKKSPLFVQKLIRETVNPMSDSHHYIVIMAGGSGTRLWPLSRKSKPKQFQSFLSEKTMIEETYDRVKNLVPEGHIFISTTDEYHALVLEKIPQIKEENIILEPEARNTAPAIALVSTTLSILDSDAIIATIASDHAIENPDEFHATLRAAFDAVSMYPEALVTVGINPTKPDTGLGYIKMGQERKTLSGKRIFEVAAFKEKPDAATAETYLRSFEYLWNAGYFIFSVRAFSTWTRTLAPALHALMEEVAGAARLGSLDTTTLATLYQKADKDPIEPLIIEKLAPEQRLVIPSALKWSDVGSWGTLYDFLTEKSGTSSVIHGNNVDVGSKNVFIHSKKRLVATLGLEDLVIIDTDDALLVARRDQVSGEIKTLIEKLKTDGQQSYL